MVYCLFSYILVYIGLLRLTIVCLIDPVVSEMMNDSSSERPDSHLLI